MKNKNTPVHKILVSFLPRCRVLLVIGFNFFHQFDTYIFISARKKAFSPFGMEIRAFFKKKTKRERKVQCGRLGFLEQSCCVYCLLLRLLSTPPQHRGDGCVFAFVNWCAVRVICNVHVCQALVQKFFIFNSKRCFFFFYQSVLGFICLNVLRVPVRILLIYLTVTLKERSAICVTVPAEDAVFVFLFVWLHN